MMDKQIAYKMIKKTIIIGSQPHYFSSKLLDSRLRSGQDYINMDRLNYQIQLFLPDSSPNSYHLEFINGKNYS